MRPSAGTSGYHRLAVRLNKFPQGAPPTRTLYEILTLLFSPEEADLVSKLPIRVFTAGKAAKAWGMDLPAARRALDRLCGKALLVDIEQEGRTNYCLPPPMAGFFEFSLMSRRTDIDQRALAGHLYRYINLEEDFSAALFARGHTQLGRVFVNEPQIPAGYRLEVLDHERASETIAAARAIGVSRCYCRHKMALAREVCDAPIEICLTLNLTAESLIRHGHARPIDAAEALDLLAAARGSGLVQFGENVRREVNFICNCCKCCCEGMVAARRFAMQQPVNTTNFLAAVQPGACKGCGQCAAICPIEALSMDAGSAQTPVARLDSDLCLGCGLCAQVCPTTAIRLVKRARRVVTPLNTAHRVVLMAIERDTLQHIIFDNQVLHSHRALAVLLGAIIKLPPIQRLLASRQLRSRYLAAIVQRLRWQPGGANPDRAINKGEASCSISA
jgi:ferredoxin